MSEENLDLEDNGPGFKMETRAIKSELAELPISEIYVNPIGLRPVDEQDVEYLELVESVRINGVITPIQVRPKFDEETGKTTYWLINGLQRLTAARVCGYDTIQCTIRDVNELRALEEQVITNAVVVETKPHQYAKHLKQLMELDPSYTVNSLAARISRSPEWVKQRLSLLKLTPEIANLVDEDRLTLVKATLLATLPEDVQAEYLTEAATADYNAFAEIVKARRDAIRKAKTGVRVDANEFKPEPHMRKFVDVKDAVGNMELAQTIVEANGCETAVQGFLAGILWVVNMDKVALDERRKAHEEKVAAIAEKRKNADIERAKRAEKRNEITSEANKLRLKLLGEGKSREEVEKDVEKFIEERKAALKN